MKHLTYVLGVGVAALAACLVALSMPVQASPQDQAPTPPTATSVEVALPLAPTAPADSDTPDPSGEDAAEKLLADYVGEEVMVSWTPAVSQVPTASILAVAGDIAAVSANAHDAVLLAGLAYWEGARFAAYVDDGRCNDPEWRKSAEGVRLMHIGGNCDNGHAHSLWQIHPVEDQTSKMYALCNAEAVDGSRQGAARCALALANASLARRGDLADYTGEWDFEHPKADIRLDFVNRALAKHPFRP